MCALPTPALQRAAELELDRARRSGRPFSLLVLQLRKGSRARRRRAARHGLIRVVAQHVRPFDTVGHGGRSDRLVIVAPDTDRETAATIPPRLEAALDGMGVRLVGAGTATFPDDGLLLTQLIGRATSRLPADARGTAHAGVEGGDTAASVMHGRHR